MAVPTSVFRQIPITLATTALDTAGERLASISGEATINSGNPPTGGAEWDFGTIDISGAAVPVDSAVVMAIWHISADGGNTTAEDFRLYLSSNGFDDVGTTVQFQPLSGADQGTPVNTENYVANAVIGSYTWATMPESLPGAQNVYPSDEGSSMALSTTSDDAIFWAGHLEVDENETTGTYKAADVGYEFRFTYQYSYS